MKATNIIEQKNGQIYCIVDPLACLNQSNTISYHSLIECKYCKSINLPIIKSNKTQCPICRCYTDIPEDYCAIVPVTIPNFILTNQQQSKINNKITYKNKNTKQKSHKLRLLIVCEAKLDQNFIQGLQCLQPILLNYQNMQICLIIYGSQIRLVQLEEDGRVITIHYQSMELINDKFYPVSKESIAHIFTVLNNKLDNKVVINGSKVMVEVLEKMRHTDLAVLWFGNLNQSMQFYTYPSYAHTDIYCILKVPYTLTNHSQMSSLQKLNINSTRVKYILKTDTPQTITQKVYYQLYEIFQHETVSNIRVEASRQRKYPPEILTCRSRVIGSLNNNIIIKMGKNIELKEKAQIRIKYTEILYDEDREKYKNEEGTNQQQKLVTIQNRQRILIININFDNIPLQPNAQLSRYLRLYLFMKSYNLSSSIHQVEMMKINNDNDIDLCHFWKDSSFIQRAEIFCNLENNHCIYAVWPLIGISSINRKVMFVYYFTGYHISQEQQDSADRYSKQIQQLNQLCQILYCRKQKNPPLSYQHMIHQLNQSSHLNQSDQQQQEEQNEQQGSGKEMKRYYEVLIK